VTSVEALGINTVYMAHAARQIAVRGLDQQVIMVRHQTVGGYPAIPEFGRFPENLDKFFTVCIGKEYLLAPSATVHHMIPGSRIFYPQWSGHAAFLARAATKVKSGLDPFFFSTPPGCGREPGGGILIIEKSMRDYRE
jgi:hypothetical protein